MRDFDPSKAPTGPKTDPIRETRTGPFQIRTAFKGKLHLPLRHVFENDRLPQSASLQRLPRAHMIEESNPIPFHGAQRFSPTLMEGLKHHGGGRLLDAALCYQRVLSPAGNPATPDPDALL